MNAKVVITNFTDPLCTWCWGLEPVFRKLETHFPGELEFRYVMGGLVENIEEKWDPANGIGHADIPRINQQIEAHWNDASSRHGMPVKGTGFTLFSREYPSTYPQNIAYKAAQMVDAKKADRFLRRMREASAAEYLMTSHQEVLDKLAAEVGIDLKEFHKHLEDGSAEEAFKDDLKITRAFGVTGFPTCLVSYGGKQMLLRGYNDYDTFVTVIGMVSDGKVTPVVNAAYDDNAMLDFIKDHGRLALAELKEAFDFPDMNSADAWARKMKDEGKVNINAVGKSYFIEPAAIPEMGGGHYCDTATGQCM
ncbi:DsbA family protein [uncultured Muribaculum sp.]|uniref:DsbA family protein n=1 Tax=uncultured Muribaculum sp. TaxID=1918613 RepID=UPI0025931BD5|nr:DsbA family protein [uncultured Muribaculum sp.]